MTVRESFLALKLLDKQKQQPEYAKEDRFGSDLGLAKTIAVMLFALAAPALFICVLVIGSAAILIPAALVAAALRVSLEVPTAVIPTDAASATTLPACLVAKATTVQRANSWPK